MSRNSILAQVLGLLGWLLLCFAASAIGAFASIQAGTFYLELIRPEWAPPAGLFGPVWTVLYTMMAIAAWLVWRAGGIAQNRVPLSLFLAQLGVNALWSWLFFAWKLGTAAFFDIILLAMLIVATIISFWRVQALAGILLLPYLLWVLFASVLNFSLLQRNPQTLGL